MNLKQAIKLIDSAYSKHFKSDFSDNVYIKENIIRYTNRKIYIEIFLNDYYEHEFNVPLKTLKQIVTSNNTNLTFNPDSSTLSNKVLNIKLTDINKNEFSSVNELFKDPEFIESENINLSKDKVLRMFDFTSNDDLKPTLCGIIINQDMFVGTDAHYMCYDYLPKTTNFNITIPNSLKKIIKLLDCKIIPFTFSKTNDDDYYVHIKLKDVWIRINNVTPHKLNVKSVIPNSFMFKSVIETEKLKSILNDIKSFNTLDKITLTIDLLNPTHFQVNAPDIEQNLFYKNKLNTFIQFNKFYSYIIENYYEINSITNMNIAKYQYYVFNKIDNSNVFAETNDEKIVLLNPKSLKICTKDIKDVFYVDSNSIINSDDEINQYSVMQRICHKDESSTDSHYEYKILQPDKLIHFGSQEDLKNLENYFVDTETNTDSSLLFNINFNHKFMLTILKHCNGSLSFKFLKNSDAIVIDDKFLLMPML